MFGLDKLGGPHPSLVRWKNHILILANVILIFACYLAYGIVGTVLCLWFMFIVGFGVIMIYKEVKKIREAHW